MLVLMAGCGEFPGPGHRGQHRAFEGLAAQDGRVPIAASCSGVLRAQNRMAHALPRDVSVVVAADGWASTYPAG
jgi:hypothetical protein